MSLVLDSNIEMVFTKSGIEITKIVRKSDGAVLWEAYAIGTVNNFPYTGGIQEFVVPITGIYKLETWGAQGGNGVQVPSDYYGEPGSGGKGGYSYGNVKLSKGETVYIVVGGAGTTGHGGTVAGGYNGGGKGIGDGWTGPGSGGGATHIAKATGVLSSLSNNKSSVLIVAGGGGGGGNSAVSSNGGAGGGTTGSGGTSSDSSYASWSGKGGTQTSGGTGGFDGYGTAGSFGQGGIRNQYPGAGGGGGYYGGGYGSYANGATAGGGGSGYIGGVENGATINGQQSGNGKAAITFVSRVSSITVTYIIEGKTYTEEKAVGVDCLTPSSFIIPEKSGYVFYGWSYTQNGTPLTSCTAGGSNITLYGVYGPCVYNASYNWSQVGSPPSRSISVNNTTYVSKADILWSRIGGTPDEDERYNSGNVTILTLTAAAKNFKYADVTFAYSSWTDFGHTNIYLDSVGPLECGEGVVTYVTKTLDLSNNTSCNAMIDQWDRSDAYTFWAQGFIGVAKVVLHN